MSRLLIFWIPCRPSHAQRSECATRLFWCAILKTLGLPGIRPNVFYPTFILLAAAVGASVAYGDGFFQLLNQANDWVLSVFGRAYSAVVFSLLALCAVIPFTPFGKLRIGGPKAVPFLTTPRWFSIVLCTTIATGILFWGTAEPLFHYTSPPDGLGLEPGTDGARRFALTTLFLHWSFSPYAIYALPALVFAVGYYNRKGAFSLSTFLLPLTGARGRSRIAPWIDNAALFGLVMGMSASLGAGVLTLKGGLLKAVPIGLPDDILVAVIALCVIAAFTISASTGLLRGIKHLSLINLVAFVILLVFVAIVGSPAVFGFAWESLLDYPSALLSEAFDEPADEGWTRDWTAFYWANWMAWAPVTALFLGRLAYGRTVREFMVVNWLLPSLFAVIWMTVFGGNVLHEAHFGSADFPAVLGDQGPEGVVYALFDSYPFTGPVTLFFVLVTFLSYTTAADSNTEAMAGISTEGISPQSPAPPVFIKIIWGVVIGATAVVAIGAAGTDGIRMLSNLGGLPALFLLVAVWISALMLIWTHRGSSRG